MTSHTSVVMTTGCYGHWEKLMWVLSKVHRDPTLIIVIGTILREIEDSVFKKKRNKGEERNKIIDS